MTVTSLGFCKMRRSSFILERQTQVLLDFELVLCPSHYDSLPYKEEQLPSIDATGLQPLVQFGTRKEHGTTEFTGFVQQGKYIRPVFTYNLWTLRANTISCDRSMRTISGDGDVIWQDGQTTKPAKHIQISLRNPLEILKME
jgi:hypothetical protein